MASRLDYTERASDHFAEQIAAAVVVAVAVLMMSLFGCHLGWFSLRQPHLRAHTSLVKKIPDPPTDTQYQASD